MDTRKDCYICKVVIYESHGRWTGRFAHLVLSVVTADSKRGVYDALVELLKRHLRRWFPNPDSRLTVRLAPSFCASKADLRDYDRPFIMIEVEAAAFGRFAEAMQDVVR